MSGYAKAKGFVPLPALVLQMIEFDESCHICEQTHSEWGEALRLAGG